METTFTTTVFQEPGMNATGLVVPEEAVAALGKGKRPPVKVTLCGYTYPSTVAVMGGRSVLPLAQEHRNAAGVQAGDEVEVTLVLDDAPRTVAVPEDLAAALEAAGVTAAFEAAAPSRRKEFVRQVESAKAAETRTRRITAIVTQLGG